MSPPTAPFAPIPLLFLETADSDLQQFLVEAHGLVVGWPTLVTAVEKDLDGHSRYFLLRRAPHAALDNSASLRPLCQGDLTLTPQVGRPPTAPLPRERGRRLDGTSRPSGLERLQDALKCTLRRRQDFVVGEMQDREAKRLEPLVPLAVVRLAPVVGRPVDFHDERRLVAVEIHHEGTHRVLAPELVAQPSVPHQRPERRLGGRRRPSKCPRLERGFSQQPWHVGGIAGAGKELPLAPVAPLPGERGTRGRGHRWGEGKDLDLRRGCSESTRRGTSASTPCLERTAASGRG